MVGTMWFKRSVMAQNRQGAFPAIWFLRPPTRVDDSGHPRPHRSIGCRGPTELAFMVVETREMPLPGQHMVNVSIFEI